jgi:hypothetical protein
MWEWDVRVVDIEAGVEGDQLPRCVGGRGAAPPEFCGGPTGYRLMLKRQRLGAAMSDPVPVKTVLKEGFQSRIQQIVSYRASAGLTQPVHPHL